MIKAPNQFREEIITIDLLLSELINRRARFTSEGYNFISTTMWDWDPHFPISKNLLPKTIR